MRIFSTLLLSIFLVWVIYFFSEKKTWDYDIISHVELDDACHITSDLVVTYFVDEAGVFRLHFFGNVPTRMHERCQVRVHVSYEYAEKVQETVLVADDRSVNGSDKLYWSKSFDITDEFKLNPFKPASLLVKISAPIYRDDLNIPVSFSLRTHWGNWFLSSHNANNKSVANTDQWVTWSYDKSEFAGQVNAEAVLEFYYLYILRQPFIIAASAMLGCLFSVLLKDLSGAFERVRVSCLGAGRLISFRSEKSNSIETGCSSFAERREANETAPNSNLSPSDHSTRPVEGLETSADDRSSAPVSTEAISLREGPADDGDSLETEGENRRSS